MASSSATIAGFESKKPSSMFSSEFVPSNALTFSELVELQRFRTKFVDSLKKRHEETEDEISQQQNYYSWLKVIPSEILGDLKQSCNPSHLYARAGSSTSMLHPTNLAAFAPATIRIPDIVANSMPPGALDPTPQASTLRSVLLFREELKRRAAQIARQTSPREQTQDKKQQAAEESTVTEEVPEEDTSAEKALMGPHHHGTDVVGERASPDELVITVRVYRPFLQHRNYRTCLLGEYLLLGCQTLAHLRDVIMCEFDYASLAGDLSERPNAITEGLPLAKDRYPSGYFFINETFYDDMRSADARRLSQVVIDHAQSHGHAAFRRADCDMAEARLNQLTLKVGYPYLYVHQGNCEHLFVITDIRIFNATSDCSLVTCYPVVLQRRRLFRRPCMCCWRLGAKWAVSNCVLCPEDPTLMCGLCADRLLFDERGHRLGEAGPFKLYALPSVSLGFPASSLNKTKAMHHAMVDSDKQDLFDLPVPRDEQGADLIDSEEEPPDEDEDEEEGAGRPPNLLLNYNDGENDN